MLRQFQVFQGQEIIHKVLSHIQVPLIVSLQRVPLLFHNLWLDHLFLHQKVFENVLIGSRNRPGTLKFAKHPMIREEIVSWASACRRTSK